MDKIDRFIGTGMACGIILFSVGYFAPRACGTYDSDASLAGGAASSLPAPSADSQTPHSLVGEPSGPPPLEAGVRLSGQVAPRTEERPALDHMDPREVAGSSPALATQLLNYEESFLPTEAGLIDMTIGVWDNPDFLSLTQDEAHELLALDDTMGLHGPELMTSIAGQLPSIDDCRIGFRSERVRRALEIVCYWDVAIVECPREKAAARPGLVALRDRAMLDLMTVLEQETTFGGWMLWYRLYREWSR